MDFRSHPAPNTLATSLEPPRSTIAVHPGPATPQNHISSAAAPLPCLRFPSPIGPSIACLMPPVSHSPHSQPTTAIAESPSPLQSWSWLLDGDARGPSLSPSLPVWYLPIVLFISLAPSQSHFFFWLCWLVLLGLGFPMSARRSPVPRPRLNSLAPSVIYSSSSQLPSASSAGLRGLVKGETYVGIEDCFTIS
ncbi:hypothetical protein BKA56DRAFT_572188 [Ilyonectria sp. MPI-CAGE-AT-0026]|nr:hypothetical protein BKA56DRAFT_572188 [Ilyonectria sp. MPI-CAGE-AT-0026]